MGTMQGCFQDPKLGAKSLQHLTGKSQSEGQSLEKGSRPRPDSVLAALLINFVTLASYFLHCTYDGGG